MIKETSLSDVTLTCNSDGCEEEIIVRLVLIKDEIAISAEDVKSLGWIETSPSLHYCPLHHKGEPT